MKIKPLHISLFLFLVLGLLFGLSFLSTKSTTDTEGFHVANTTVKYPTTATLLQQEPTDSVSDEKPILVLEQVTKQIEPIEVEKDKASDTLLKYQSIFTDKKEKVVLPDISKIDSTTIQRIAYPNNTFLSELKQKIQSNKCRIIHYGDSQLEGDRITGYLRNRLQKLYGGSGPGFIPIKQAYHQISAVVKHSNNWTRHPLFDPTQQKFSHKKYGAFLSVSRFNSLEKDSISTDSSSTTKATISISPSRITYRKFRNYSKISLHYGNCTKPTSIKVFRDDELVLQDSLSTDGNYHAYTINRSLNAKEIKIELESTSSPDFYGLTLDGKSGIQIDNVAMRGASGNHFTRNNKTTYKNMLKELDPKIIIMQFGGNVVPYLKDSLAVDKYTKNIRWQVNRIRSLKSNLQFLFIGPTDLCTSKNGKMVTYELLPYLNQQLKASCLENNVAYWDMFNAMGGNGAMELWVEKNLAGKDYVHFTPKGTKYISELFFISLYLDLQKKNINE
ncbi:GDSL-type esterase/lipase family protein [Pseudofulvibacter geojedonensis]|uniref:GDSL-type esterase/lipase family protein n=1 Tax=Pseudofulvibacter geojedonensis TaxID=1123758 RepID=A0ABW3HZH6_9FLAO